MKHTTHYRIRLNNRDLIVTLTKPLPEAQFFQNPRAYCQKEDKLINALVHEDNLVTEYYFHNYHDSLRYFNYLKQLLPHYEFLNVYDS